MTCRSAAKHNPRHYLTTAGGDRPARAQLESAKWLLNGWAMDGVLSIASGMPYNVSFGTETFLNDFNGTGEYYGRPDLVGDPYAGTGGVKLLNLTALAVPNGIPGNLPRNAFVGPNFRNFDFSLVKNTALTERFHMQLRADFFNIFNHPNLASPLWPGYEADMLTNGMDGTGHGIDFLRSTVTPDVGLGNPYLGGGGPRGIQLAVKFSF